MPELGTDGVLTQVRKSGEPSKDRALARRLIAGYDKLREINVVANAAGSETSLLSKAFDCVKTRVFCLQVINIAHVRIFEISNQRCATYFAFGKIALRGKAAQVKSMELDHSVRTRFQSSRSRPRAQPNICILTWLA